MDRKTLMQNISKEAFDRRIGLSALCAKAGISRTVAYRFQRNEYVPSLPTIGKLEQALRDMPQ
ncbi:MAG: hypothetical protein IPM41_16220 [Sphingomonadales bacterium]|nr:hypothetical protein [Sphingomonadales bacterium]MBK9005333.1 hypothetical protein [Sphingomonadales bacterium]